ncbi:MAG TPA: sn-glycerol-3-phosphate ABC transporter ATP-binding protein UgpC [Burkholderiaceae bacterium]|nr:sn-glycerol-3-phosphate ABC transporter ATP-binding protein UgpC [Burkholderiaceae bacterium]
MASLVIRDLSKRFGSVEVLKNVNLEANAGEFIALVGPSGCGKSTLLAMLAGLESVTSGRIEIGGRVVNDVAPKDRDIAMVFQSYALYPTMTVRENITFGMESRRVPKAEQNEAVARVASLLQIGELLGRRPAQLSGGQRQRVAMGRALVRDPALFLFDEPLSNLDAKLRVEMRTEIKKLHQRVKKTTIYVTHDQVEAMTLASRVAVLHKGVLQQFDRPRVVYDRPANRFVAGFMGSPSMNFIPGELVEEGGKPCIALPGNGSPAAVLPLATSVTNSARKIVLGVRPEHMVRDTGGGTKPGYGRMDATVEVVEPTGAETMVVMRVGAQEITARFEADSVPAVGEKVRVNVDMNKACLFDPDSEKLLG